MTWDYWEILLLAPIMLADYFLTILGARTAQGTYTKHFNSGSYELNPVWRSAVKTRRWFNFRHHVPAVVVPITMFFVERSTLPRPVPLFGLINAGMLSMYALILGHHAGNLLLFRRMARRPTEVTGTVKMSHTFELANARYRVLASAFPLVVGAALSRHPVALGAALGPVLYLLALSVWSANSRPGDDRPRQPDGDDAGKLAPDAP
ncbi:MAG: hypothetical protein IT452_16325 [Planctomycetia bacterium]|nr:hypothetical protein [Planctomycetia bacterium]